MVAKAAASGFLLLAVFIFWMSRRTATATLDKLHRHDVASASRRFVSRAAWALIALTAAVGFVIWRL